MESAQDHAGTPRRRAARRPASIFGRSLGFGAVTGGAIGLLIALILVVIPTVTGATAAAGSGVLTSLGALVFVGSYAIGFGAIVGLVCGFVASIPLLIAQEIATSRLRPPVRGRSARPGLRRSVSRPHRRRRRRAGSARARHRRSGRARRWCGWLLLLVRNGGVLSRHAAGTVRGLRQPAEAPEGHGQTAWGEDGRPGPTLGGVTDTRRKLVDGTIETLRARGIAGTSARAIAAAADVNQALIFYHFGSVEQLVDTACRTATAERVALYQSRFAAVGSLRELLHLGRELNVSEREAGNVTALAQVLAGAQQDDKLAAAAREALGLWVTEIEQVLIRVLAGSPIAEVADPAGLAHGITAAFVGIELYEGVNPAAAAAALDTLEQLAVLAEVIEDLGPVARRALRARIRRTAR